MFLCSKVIIEYLTLIEQGRLRAALKLLKAKTTDYPEMYNKVIHLSCRYYLIIGSEIIDFPIPEKMVQLNLLSLAMIDIIEYRGSSDSRIIN